MRVICVDDETVILKEMLDVFTDRTDIDCKFFSREPQKAIEYAKKHKVDLAILDVCLGDDNGFDIAQGLIATNEEIKILFITGFSYDERALTAPSNVLGVLGKPLSESDIRHYVNLTAKQAVLPEIHTFGAFGVKVNGENVRFISEKARELLAFLVHRNGQEVSMEETICALWADKELDKAKIMYRDSVWKLRRSLENHHISGLVDFRRKALCMKKENAKCDYWDLLDGKSTEFRGEYMTSYDWSLEMQSYLENKYII